jgi:hypothetical protein
VIIEIQYLLFTVLYPVYSVTVYDTVNSESIINTC